MKTQSMTPLERRTTFSLAGIFSLRMLGLFMILPVFSLYATDHLRGATPVLVGLAIGAYGLTQALLQIPFGMLSDRYGRKPVITGGLVIFAVGSVVAAISDTITGVIIGRALQGSGAIAAAVMALAADNTREEHRTKAMAAIGMSIGLSFAASLILGPVLNSWIGVPGIFWLTALLAVIGIGVLNAAVPHPGQRRFHRDTEVEPGSFSGIIRDSQLLRLDFGIFVLHMTLTASFVVLPFALRDFAGIDSIHHWHIYLPVLLLSLAVMVPLVILAEKYRHIKQVFIGAILAVGIAQLSLMEFYHTTAGIFLALLLYFIAFNLLEALLPSLVAKYAPADRKGTAMGVYSTSQFMGAFSGGIVGGGLYGIYGLGEVFGFCAVAAVLWALWAITMRQPSYLSSHMIRIKEADLLRSREIEERLRQIEGVSEATVVVEEGVAYLKVDSKVVDYEELDAFSVASGQGSASGGGGNNLPGAGVGGDVVV